jgi:hypothetical protein
MVALTAAAVNALIRSRSCTASRLPAKRGAWIIVLISLR